jgi:hypothetical protein
LLGADAKADDALLPFWDPAHRLNARYESGMENQWRAKVRG